MQAPELTRRTIGLLGVPLDVLTLQEAAHKVRQAVHERQRMFLSTPNLNFLMGCQKDPEFRLSVIDSDLSTADGMPLLWMTRLFGMTLPERVTGSDLFEYLRSQPLPPGNAPIKMYFFGGPDGAAKIASENLAQTSSSMSCVGYASPGFGSVDVLSASEYLDAINASGADFLVIAMGAAKGQAWIQRNRAKLNVPVISHLGAVINFSAGSVLRAPGWVQKNGLEWLWRIKEEPQLWRRYGNDAATFCQIFFLKLLPQLLFTAASRWLQKPHDFKVELAAQPNASVLHVSGMWSDQSDATWQGFKSKVRDASGLVTVDLDGLQNLRLDFAGELLDLYRLLRTQNRNLVLQASSSRMNNMLIWNGLDFLHISSATAL